MNLKISNVIQYIALRYHYISILKFHLNYVLTLKPEIRNEYNSQLVLQMISSEALSVRELSLIIKLTEVKDINQMSGTESILPNPHIPFIASYYS